MVQITILDNKTVVKVDDIEIFITGDFEIKKKEPAITGSKGDNTTVKIDAKEIANLCCQNLTNRGNFAKEQ